MRRLVVLAALAPLVSCLTEGPPVSLRPVYEKDAGPQISTEVPIVDASFELGPVDPHAVIGVDPSHGPFNGGQARILRGNGFASGLRVWFGGREIATENVIPIDPSRAQVIVPPGIAGPADVKAQIGSDASTARTLAGGYVYEDFYAEPSSGGTSGGTLIHLFGQNTSWSSDTIVTIDDKPCEPVEALSPTELTCTTPAAPAGTKSVRIRSSSRESTVRDAFTYADSDNGYAGGLSGKPLDNHLKVLAYGAYSGLPISDAFVVAGDDTTTGLTKRTDSAGMAVFESPSLGPKRSVTIAAKCYQPTTFIDVPVDVVTAFLTPVLTPPCIPQGDPPSTGGHGVAAATLSGEIVWGVDGEFRSLAWKNLPAPTAPTEKLAVYVSRLTGNPSAEFWLPNETDAIRPDTPGGKIGYPFSMVSPQGNQTLYALAGIEDRAANPPRFTAYVMGIVRGVAAELAKTTYDIFIPMNIPLDHAVSLVAKTPQASVRGPDRAKFTVTLEVEKGGYAVLPAGVKSSLLPVDTTLTYVGLPALSGALSGARYIASGLAGTGPSFTTPLSLVGRFPSTTETLGVGEFLPIPVLSSPAYGAKWDGKHLSFVFAPTAVSVDLTVFSVQSAGGLISWSVVVPGGGTQTVTLPDLRSAFPDGALEPGSLSINIFGGHLAGFNYATLRYAQMSPSGFEAYAMDVVPARTE